MKGSSPHTSTRGHSWRRGPHSRGATQELCGTRAAASAGLRPGGSLQGPGRAAAELVAAIFRATPSSLPLPSRPRPSTSIPDPRGTGPGKGRRCERYLGARRRRLDGAGARGANPRRPAARPYLGSAGPSAALRSRAPPRAGLRAAAARARFLNAKALLLFFVPGIPLSSRPRASRSFPRVCGAHSPPPPPQTRSPEPTRICLGAHDPSRST
nr:uncharacterized protein LOC104652567 isoform X1 [Saimiri boliviensis boliviensis]